MAYTTIDNSESAFQILGYTGNGSTSSGISRTFSGSVNLKPGLTYHHKYSSNNLYHHNIMENEYTGPGTLWLTSGGDSVVDGITASYDTNGFTHATQNLGGYYHNQNGESYGVWAWKESGASNANNTDGTISSVVRVNSDIGLSIVNWTGTSADGTIGHGLGKLPDSIWMYPIQVAANNGNTQRPQWWRGLSWNHVFNTGLNEGRTQSDSTNGRIGAYSHGSTQGTTSVFSVFSGNSSYEAVNHSSQNYMALVWTRIKGFSHFGSYEGSGSTQGQFVYCGFKPALIIIKGVDQNQPFGCYDENRDPINQGTGGRINLTANFGVEGRDGNTKIDFLSNGFRVKSTHAQMNAYNNTYSFGAFAAEPLVTSTGIPATAR